LRFCQRRYLVIRVSTSIDGFLWVSYFYSIMYRFREAARKTAAGGCGRPEL
jgi:hypothetical protein